MLLPISNTQATACFRKWGGTLGKGKVSIDLLNNTGYRDSVRIGLPRGELIYATNVAGVANDMLGYKHPINSNISIYGLVNFDSNADSTDMIFGAAYSGGDSKFWYNVSGEMLSPGDGGDSTFEIKAGGYYEVHSEIMGRMYLAGEIIYDNTLGTANMYAAVHFVPYKNVNIDVGLYK